MTSSNLKPIRISIAITAFFLILISTGGYVFVVRKIPEQSLETVIMASTFQQLAKEVDLSEKRKNSVQILVIDNSDEKKREFERIANNALAFMDPDGIESVLSELGNLNTDLRSDTFDKLRYSASELFSDRARKRRFESHQLMQMIDKIESQLTSDSTASDLKIQRDILAKTRAILLTEYPNDTQRAIALNPDNARAIYDLSRFMQDKIGSYDRGVVIRNFERVIELRWGKTEKDGDFLNANINLTVLSYETGNEAKAKCYSGQTLEKHLARSQSDYEYLFGFQPDGRINEPEFRLVTNKVNPTWDLDHPKCLLIRGQ